MKRRILFIVLALLSAQVLAEKSTVFYGPAEKDSNPAEVLSAYSLEQSKFERYTGQSLDSDQMGPLHFIIEKPQTINNSKDLVLHIDRQRIDTILFFWQDQSGQVHGPQNGGLMNAYEDSSASLIGFEFRVPQKKFERALVHIEHTTPVILPFNWFSEPEHEKSVHYISILVGLFFGLLFVLFLISFSVGALNKDQSYTFYGLYLAAMLVFQLVFYHYIFEWFSADSGLRNAKIFLFAASLTEFTSMYFARSFLGTSGRYPRINAVFSVFILIVGLNMLGVFFLPRSILNISTNALMFVEFFILLPSALYIAYRGFSPAYYFSAAWIGFFLGGVSYGLWNLGIVHVPVLGPHGLQFGVAFEVLFLTFAVADNIRLLQDQKEEANQRMIMEANRRLKLDQATGLPNRSQLLDDIQGQARTLILVNVNQFKLVNTFYGTVAGDRIIEQFLTRIRAFSERYRWVNIYRLHADEFVYLVTKSISHEELAMFSFELAEFLETPAYSIEGRQYRIAVTVGAVLNREQALLKADIAMSAARTEGVKQQIFHDDLKVIKDNQQNIFWTNQIIYNLEHNKVIPLYQPIVDYKTGKIVKYESLMRLSDTDGNLVSPYFFLDIAKKARLYHELSRRMVQQVFDEMENHPHTISINLSEMDVTHEDNMLEMLRKIRERDIGKRLVIELLETEEFSNFEDVSNYIKELKKLGCRIAIDDFGSGYSNFDHIFRLNADFLKIDSTLIKDIDRDKNAQIIVESIVQVATKLGYKTISEFVHSETVHNICKGLNIDFAQGYYLGEPDRNIFKL